MTRENREWILLAIRANGRPPAGARWGELEQLLEEGMVSVPSDRLGLWSFWRITKKGSSVLG